MTREEFIQLVASDIKAGDIRMAKGRIGNFACTTPSFKPEDEQLLRSITEELWRKYPVLKETCDESEYERKGKLTTYTPDDWSYAVLALQENCCPERLEDVIKIGKAIYGKKVTPVQEKSASDQTIELEVNPIEAGKGFDSPPNSQREKNAPKMSPPQIKKKKKNPDFRFYS